LIESKSEALEKEILKNYEEREMDRRSKEKFGNYTENNKV
jgi:hypothetical protein